MGGERGRPAESRAVALWKDQEGGMKIIELHPEAKAFLLTINAVRKVEFTADGRRDSGSACFVFQGSRDLYGRRDHRASDRSAPPGAAARGERDVEDLTVFAYFVDAVLDAPHEERLRLSQRIDYRSPQAPSSASGNDTTLAAFATNALPASEPSQAVLKDDPPHRREPFLTIWDRVHRSRKQAEQRTPPGAHTERANGLGRALDEFIAFMKPYEPIVASAEEPWGPKRERWIKIEKAAAGELMRIRDGERRPTSEGEPLRISRLAHLIVLWAIHNRAHRRMQDILSDRNRDTERGELYRLLVQVEEDLGLYS